MQNRAQLTADKAAAMVRLIELEEKERKALEVWRNAGGRVAKAKAWAEVTKLRAQLRDERLIIHPRKGRKRERSRGVAAKGTFLGALMGNGG